MFWKPVDSLAKEDDTRLEIYSLSPSRIISSTTMSPGELWSCDSKEEKLIEAES